MRPGLRTKSASAFLPLVFSRSELDKFRTPQRGAGGERSCAPRAARAGSGGRPAAEARRSRSRRWLWRRGPSRGDPPPQRGGEGGDARSRTVAGCKAEHRGRPRDRGGGAHKLRGGEHNGNIMFSGDREAGRAGRLHAFFAGGMTGRPTPIMRIIGGAGRSDPRRILQRSDSGACSFALRFAGNLSRRPREAERRPGSRATAAPRGRFALVFQFGRMRRRRRLRPLRSSGLAATAPAFNSAMDFEFGTTQPPAQRRRP